MKKKKIEISASIMCIDWLNAGKQLKVLEDEKIDYLHWDIMDGDFAKNFTMGSSIVNTFKKTVKLPSDFHLMVEEPSRVFDIFNFSQGDFVTIHIEAARNLHRDLLTLKKMGVKVGVGMCPATTVDSLEYIINDIDSILVMTVNPGFAGQDLVPQTINKIAKIKELCKSLNLNPCITVDGNVNYENIPKMVNAGGTRLVGGSSGLFRTNKSLKESIRSFRKAIEKGLET